MPTIWVVGGISFVELLMLYESWAGVRRVLENASPSITRQDVQFQCRLFHLDQALICGFLAGLLGVFLRAPRA